MFIQYKKPHSIHRFQSSNLKEEKGPSIHRIHEIHNYVSTLQQDTIHKIHSSIHRIHEIHNHVSTLQLGTIHKIHQSMESITTSQRFLDTSPKRIKAAPSSSWVMNIETSRVDTSNSTRFILGNCNKILFLIPI